MNAFMRVTPWVLRVFLLAIALLFTMIGLHYLTDPVARAATDEIGLKSVMAVSRARVGFGAFPLSFAALTVACLISERRILYGLFAVATVLGIVTVVRVSGILIDGTAPEAIRLLRVELMVWTLSMVAIAVETVRRRRLGWDAPRAAASRAPTRYHPGLVVLHWALAFLVVGALLLGTFVLKAIPNSSPDKIHGLRAHVLAGIAILGLMIFRLGVRLTTAKPPKASAGSAALDRLASVSHHGMYALVLLQASTGLATAILAGLFMTLFGSGGTLPETFNAYPTRIAHGYIAKALFFLIGLHIFAALYHQFIRKDRLLSRMWFGRRGASADPTRAFTTPAESRG